MPNNSVRLTTRHLRSAFALATLAALAAACGDSSTAPAVQPRGVAINRPVLDKLMGSTTVTYDPSKGVYASVGDRNMIYIPANGVCDPGRSSYGIGTWDLPCNAVTHTLVISAQTWMDSNGHPYIQFSPALRFVPNKMVVLYIADGKAVLDATARIIYCPDAGSCVDEAKSDLSLFTFHWSNGVYRRIKHFSGYNVAAGLDGE